MGKDELKRFTATSSDVGYTIIYNWYTILLTSYIILQILTISYNYVGCSASLVWAGLRFCGDFCQIFCCVFFFCLKAYPCYCMTAMLRLCMLWSHCSSGLPMIPQTLMKRIFQNGCQQSVGGPSMKWKSTSKCKKAETCHPVAQRWIADVCIYCKDDPIYARGRCCKGCHLKFIPR